ncbi:unnamed protein product [Mytilus coruscus]|uniref:Hexosyltransferase n=1 Tax=Mytilus coruscus TaxID=42192 RepID=A0A6J8DTN5_MYTCO|nr:unnamed protein product [Mytilus coruscus]
MDRRAQHIVRLLLALMFLTSMLTMFLMALSLDVKFRATPLDEILKSTTEKTVLLAINTAFSLANSITNVPNETMTNKTAVKPGELFGKNVNLHPYIYIRKPSTICNSTGYNPDPNLLILVKSNVLQIGRRMAIRATWGNLTNTSIHIAFLLGYSPLVESFIKMEYNVHKDLVQEDFIDRYRNNTLKTIMGFNWAASYCRQAKFVLFVDDDYYVNIPNLINLIKNIRKSKNQNVFIGHNQTHTEVQRNKNNKWYVSTEDYPNTNWPPFISGGSMLLSMDIVTKFANTFPYVKMITLDDVYLGMVAKILKIKLTHDKRFSIRFVRKKLDTLITSHDYGSPNDLVHEFNRLLQMKKGKINF